MLTQTKNGLIGRLLRNRSLLQTILELECNEKLWLIQTNQIIQDISYYSYLELKIRLVELARHAEPLQTDLRVERYRRKRLSGKETTYRFILDSAFE